MSHCIGPPAQSLNLFFIHAVETVLPRLCCRELRHCLALLLLQARQFLLKSGWVVATEKIMEPRSRSRPLPCRVRFYET